MPLFSIRFINPETGNCDFELPHANGRIEELTDALTCKPEGVEELIVGIRHISMHQGSIMVGFDHTEYGVVLTLVECVKEAPALFLEGHILRHEFEILDAYYVLGETADSVTDDEDLLLRELDDVSMLLSVSAIYACHEAWSDAVSAERSQELHAIISA